MSAFPFLFEKYSEVDVKMFASPVVFLLENSSVILEMHIRLKRALSGFPN
jgi:hypothetical protein